MFSLQELHVQKLLDEYPIEPLASMPKLAKIEGKHKGNVVGLKGKFLIYQNGGLKAINLQRVPGRTIQMLDIR